MAPTRSQLKTSIVLALVLATTRIAHFNHDLVPTDASWAVFLLGGALLREPVALLGLCALAGGVDLAAFALGVSQVCMSGGYVFMLAGYALLWWAGRIGGAGELRRLPRVGAAAALGAVAAFAVTNVGYYAFSPSLASMAPGAFVKGVAPYLPWYVVTTLAYTLTGHLLAHAAAAAMPIGRSQRGDAA
jgi:hypothetical protein